MKNTLFCLLFLCLLFSFSSGQNKRYILEGNIGKSPVVFMLDDYGNNDLSAKYFYKSTLRDIRLEYEKAKNGDLIFSFADTYIKYKEKFVLKRKSTTVFEGIWKDSKNKELSVSLHEADLSQIKNPFLDSKYIQQLRKEAPEDFIRSSYLVFRKDTVSGYNGHKTDWYSEKFSKTSFMRISATEKSEAKNVINKKLFDLHLEMAINQLSCSNYSAYNDAEGIDYSTSISYWDSNLLGFSNFSSYFCGGAHPDFGSTGYLFDLHSGKEYELDDIIAFDKSVTTESKTNFTAYSAYRSNFFAPTLAKLMIKQHQFEKPKDQEEDPCDYTNVEYWNFPSWTYTKEGIVFTPIFYRAARSCEDSFLLPFKTLMPYKNKDFKYQLK
ncbi:hypothetical protein HZP39_06965 [Elizabethkingia anophelis]|uniref:hypothetical protein n=1 Tax=Elizabethkingia anophelis TaxID=1117645 RepID=UPI0024E10059|nr:hypothetical protein [Elizabethkingia anophelis]MCT4230762.1 hypothetical protein [Elizabethkingia anophelis]MCT4239963.1 hypothetical protein [Elizabethkingia anophelis]MCT4284050.1 hypothetical protein [Elizabethkingia anophelis]MCT4294807.1 hypothetical protein [Elizabethkingia anophelis]HDP3251154.1 hypothetical protein [Elizabethkingia anophelis]